jgi:hypothetical protein
LALSPERRKLVQMVATTDEPAQAAEREIAPVSGGLTRGTWSGLVVRTREVHRYFPEWADRVPQAGAQVEADRNSYLAGGYAEEFGYLEQRGTRAALPLIGDPERSLLWHAHVGGLHPGYPECPTPQDREAPRLAALRGDGRDEGRAGDQESAAAARLTQSRGKRIGLTERAEHPDGRRSRRRLRFFY